MVNLDNKVQEESSKKAWIAPEMEEVNVNGGFWSFKRENTSANSSKVS